MVFDKMPERNFITRSAMIGGMCMCMRMTRGKKIMFYTPR